MKKRYPSLTPTQRKFTLWGCSLKDCTRYAVQVRCTWLRHESSANRNCSQPRPTPWGASDGSPAADCGVGGGIASLAAFWRVMRGRGGIASLAAEKAKSHRSTFGGFQINSIISFGVQSISLQSFSSVSTVMFFPFFSESKVLLSSPFCSR